MVFYPRAVNCAVPLLYLYSGLHYTGSLRSQASRAIKDSSIQWNNLFINFAKLYMNGYFLFCWKLVKKIIKIINNKGQIETSQNRSDAVKHPLSRLIKTFCVLSGTCVCTCTRNAMIATQNIKVMQPIKGSSPPTLLRLCDRLKDDQISQYSWL